MPRRITPLDKEIGGRIKRMRRNLGLTQENLAQLIGVTFQQVQKYETGKNRISAAMLKEISKTLQCTVLDLLENIETAEINETEEHILNDWRNLPTDEHRCVVQKLMRWLRNDQNLPQSQNY